jgi:signal transduction histidine kinase
LERVLINLVANARDAMPKGGVIKITSGRLDNQPNWVYLSIADTGGGIPADALGKVFDLLYTTKAEGSALGLWLSRRIVHEHGGKLEVQSELGRGTTFTIKLPLNDFQE